MSEGQNPQETSTVQAIFSEVGQVKEATLKAKQAKKARAEYVKKAAAKGKIIEEALKMHQQKSDDELTERIAERVVLKLKNDKEKRKKEEEKEEEEKKKQKIIDETDALEKEKNTIRANQQRQEEEDKRYQSEREPLKKTVSFHKEVSSRRHQPALESFNWL